MNVCMFVSSIVLIVKLNLLEMRFLFSFFSI